MDSAKKALLFGAGLFITIALITLFVIVYSTATDATKEAQSDFSGLQTELKDQKFSAYDNTNVSGSQVINAARKFQKQGEEQTLGIYVQTGKEESGSGTWYYMNSTEPDELTKGTESLAGMQSENAKTYVNPSGQFKANVVYDKNGVVRALRFIQS